MEFVLDLQAMDTLKGTVAVGVVSNLSLLAICRQSALSVLTCPRRMA